MSEHADLVKRYQHLRRVALELNNRLMKSLPKSVMDEGSKKLGLLKRNTLVLDTEDEIAVFADYCIYDVRRQGKNAIERFLQESPPPPDSDEMRLLQGMRAAHYTLIVAETPFRGVGVQAHDLLRDEPVFVCDVGFSMTAPAGLVMACRLLTVDDVTMTTGAPLPVGLLPPELRTQIVQGLRERFRQADFRNLTPKESSDISADVIRMCLQQGAAGHIEYLDAGEASPRGAAPRDRGQGRRASAKGPRSNGPCPCGSGKRYKNCCGPRR